MKKIVKIYIIIALGEKTMTTQTLVGILNIFFVPTIIMYFLLKSKSEKHDGHLNIIVYCILTVTNFLLSKLIALFFGWIFDYSIAIDSWIFMAIAIAVAFVIAVVLPKISLKIEKYQEKKSEKNDVVTEEKVEDDKKREEK